MTSFNGYSIVAQNTSTSNSCNFTFESGGNTISSTLSPQSLAQFCGTSINSQNCIINYDDICSCTSSSTVNSTSYGFSYYAINSSTENCTINYSYGDITNTENTTITDIPPNNSTAFFCSTTKPESSSNQCTIYSAPYNYCLPQDLNNILSYSPTGTYNLTWEYYYNAPNINISSSITSITGPSTNQPASSSITVQNQSSSSSCVGNIGTLIIADPVQENSYNLTIKPQNGDIASGCYFNTSTQPQVTVQNFTPNSINVKLYAEDNVSLYSYSIQSNQSQTFNLIYGSSEQSAEIFQDVIDVSAAAALVGSGLGIASLPIAEAGTLISNANAISALGVTLTESDIAAVNASYKVYATAAVYASVGAGGAASGGGTFGLSYSNNTISYSEDQAISPASLPGPSSCTSFNCIIDPLNCITKSKINSTILIDQI
jgi:hypothetical protein